jgi:hypothetical protein
LIITTSPRPPVDVRPMTLTLAEVAEVAEVALELRCTRRSFERQIAGGQLQVLRIGGRSASNAGGWSGRW